MKVRTLHWKQAVFAVLLTLLLNVAGMTHAMAQEFTVGDLNYSVNDDGVSVTVTGHVYGEWATGTLTIPESVTYEGMAYPVITIGEDAFDRCWHLTGSLTIPNSVTTIGEGAFSGCLGFTGSLIIPNSVTTIGNWAFHECFGFNGTLTLSNSLTEIGAGTFEGCSGFTGDLIIPNSVIIIGYSAFSECSGFNGTLTLSNSLTAICSNAFEGCSGFTGDLVIPNSVTILGGFFDEWGEYIDYGASYVFAGCSGFNGTLTLSNSLTDIGSGAFYGCSGFTGDLVIPVSVQSLSYWGYPDENNGAFEGCSGFTGDLTILGETYIGANTFSGCNGFTGTLTIGAFIWNIGGNAFSGCEGFSSIIMLGYPWDPEYVFNGINTEIPVYVTCGTLEYFQQHPFWSNFSNLQESDPCLWEVLVMPDPTEGGTVSGSGIYVLEEGEFEYYIANVNLCATPNEGYTFNYWTEYDQLVWDWNPLSSCNDGFIWYYGTPTHRYFEAHFTPISSEITAIANPDDGGTISGAGTYDYGAECTLTAIANESYTFVNWTENEYMVSTNSTYSFTVTSDRTLVANFALPFTVTATASPTEGGVVSGGGEYDYGTECTLTATANEGYTFMYWTEDGNQVSTDATYSFTVTADRNIVANFALPFSISVEANLTEGGIVSGGGEYDYGTECTLAATANEGYTFMYWTEDGNLVSTDAIYSFTVTTDRNLVANFALPFTITATANPPEGGTITGSGMYDYGSTCTLTATAAEGYYVAGWKKNGEVVSTNATYTFTVTENGDYIAVFDPGLYLGDGGTATRTDLPSLFFRRYTLSQQIYTADEIGMDGLITSIAFYNGGLTRTRNYNFYMINTDKTVFENSNDWITVTEEDLVYSGNVTMEAGSWTTIVLDTPFSYSVNSNLALITDDNTGSSTGSMAYRVFDADGNQAIRIFSDDTNYDPYNPSNYDGTLLSVKNQIILGMVSASDTFVISTIVNPAEGGTVTGDGTYNYGETVILTATANESYNFVSWTKDGEEVSTEATYSFTVTGSATYVANFSENQISVTQTSTLSQGYNWWSTYIEQEGIDGLEMLENSLGESGVTIRSQASGYNDYYAGYGWYGSLESINNEASYRIITSAPCLVTITGNEAVPSEHPITLGQGWTWMGYLPSAAMDINVALAGLDATMGDKLKSQHGYSDYYGEEYGWYGSLNTIEPGMGLMYYSTNGEPVTFTYPDSNRGGELRANITAEHNHWKPNTYAYPDNMTVMAVVELDDEELNTEDYELAVFSANGECRGSVKLIYAEPLHRHVAFLTVSGKDAAKLSFRLYDTETGTEYYDAEESLDFVANAIVGDATDLYVIHFRGMSSLDEFAKSVQVYPNPVSRGERFSINLNSESKTPVRVEIIDALGVETLRAISAQMPATLTAPTTAGVYTLRITLEGKGTLVCKLVVK